MAIRAQILSSGMVGAVGILYLYDLGSAHSRETFYTLEDFAESLFYAINSHLGTKTAGIAAMTNEGQTRERRYFEEIGFDKHVVTGRMCLHTITHEKLSAFKESIGDIIEKKRIEHEKKIDTYFQKIEKKERDEGREPGELRVGDVIMYSSILPANLANNKEQRFAIASQVNGHYYQISLVISKVSCRFKRFNPETKATIGTDFINYDRSDRGYESSGCILSERFL